MYFEESGKGEALLLIHGLSANKTMFYHQVNIFKKYYRCILIDLPGFGNSKKDKIPEDIPHISNEIFSLLKSLNIEKTHILGYSLGGTIALNMLKLNSNMVGKVIASNTLYNWYGNLSLKIFFKIFKIAISSQILRENLRKFYGKIEYKTLKKRELEKMIEMFKDAPIKSIKKYIKILENFNDHPTFPQAEKILFIAGKKDKIAPEREMFKLHKKNFGSKFALLEKGDHAMCVSFWKEYNKIILDFLRQ